MESEKNSLQGGKNNDHSQRDATAAGHKRTLAKRCYSSGTQTNTRKEMIQQRDTNEHSQRDTTAAGHKRTLVTRLYKDSLTSNELNNSLKTSQ